MTNGYAFIRPVRFYFIYLFIFIVAVDVYD